MRKGGSKEGREEWRKGGSVEAGDVEKLESPSVSRARDLFFKNRRLCPADAARGPLRFSNDGAKEGRMGGREEGEERDEGEEGRKGGREEGRKGGREEGVH